ncbi:membrane protein insertion efficiency factor YidD [Citricoccus zhacaiensis]
MITQSPFTTLPDAAEWGWLRALPSTLLGWLLMAYRAVISPLYGQVCRYFPSCSAYALEAVHVHGALKGSWLSARRLGSCHPWSKGGVDAVPPGRRIWPPGRRPKIIDLNHPVIPPDPPAEQ